MTLILDVAPPAVTEYRRPPKVRRSRRMPRPSVLGVLLLGLLIGYIVAGWWLKYSFNFAIGDALARTADARYMLFSRDPHAAAIGVYWMPLPTLVQLPFVAILEPFHHPEFAGPLASAFWSAGTVAVLHRFARDIGVSSRMRFLLVGIYALNPLTIYYAAIGMSEACEFFWVAVAIWGLFRYLDAPDRGFNAILTGIGLAGMCLTKYEITPIVGLVLLFVAYLRWDELRKRQWTRAATDMVIIAAPPVFVTLIWFLYMRVITGSFTTFLVVGAGQETNETLASVGPAVFAAKHSLGGTGRFVVRYQLALGPALLCSLLLFVGATRQRVRRFAVIVTISVMLVAATVVELYIGNGIGNPRYFTTGSLMSIIACLAVAAGDGKATGSRLVSVRTSTMRFSALQPVLLIVPLIGYVTSVNLERGPTHSLESENRVFQAIAGKPHPVSAASGDLAPVYRQAAAAMDARTKPGDRVLTDTQYEGQTALYSRKLDQWIIRSDRDYKKVTDPEAGGNYRIDWALIVPPNSAATFVQSSDMAGQYVRSHPGQFTKVWSNSVAEIWKRNPKFNVGLPNPPQG